MDGLDTTHLLPDDLLAALRSLPRRTAAALDPDRIADGDRAERDARALRHGPTGSSAQELLRDAVRRTQLVAEGVRRARAEEVPVLHPVLGDADVAAWPAPAGESVDRLLEELDDAADAISELLRGVPSEAWARPVRVAGVGERAVVEVVRDHVGLLASRRSDIEAALRHR